MMLTERARPLAVRPAPARPAFAGTDPALLASRCARLTEEVTRLTERVRVLEQLEARVHVLEQFALEDPVLPILGRKAFAREAARMLRYRARHELPLSLLFLDVDRFGAITELFGQDAGDAVLQQVCAEVTGLLRASDLFGRVGAGALAVLLMRSSADEIAEKSRQLGMRLNGTPAIHLELPIPFTVSLSLQDCAEFETIEALIETARADVLSRRTGMSTIETMTSLIGS